MPTNVEEEKTPKTSCKLVEEWASSGYSYPGYSTGYRKMNSKKDEIPWRLHRIARKKVLDTAMSEGKNEANTRNSERGMLRNQY